MHYLRAIFVNWVVWVTVLPNITKFEYSVLVKNAFSDKNHSLVLAEWLCQLVSCLVIPFNIPLLLFSITIVWLLQHLKLDSIHFIETAKFWCSQFQSGIYFVQFAASHGQSKTNWIFVNPRSFVIFVLVKKWIVIIVMLGLPICHNKCSFDQCCFNLEFCILFHYNQSHFVSNLWSLWNWPDHSYSVRIF